MERPIFNLDADRIENTVSISAFVACVFIVAETLPRNGPYNHVTIYIAVYIALLFHMSLSYAVGSKMSIVLVRRSGGGDVWRESPVPQNWWHFYSR
jgi:hypothetical protein